MFTDSNGRFVTAGQWHDEKFFAFMSPPEIQAEAPSYLLLGGMEVQNDLSAAQLLNNAATAEATPVVVS